MKENVTTFDLEAAFKALDEVEIPKVRGIQSKSLNLDESVKRVDKTSLLVEDYIDIQDKKAVEEAKEVRDAEIAQAKLAKIEKIVDLDANSPEELALSYVGKTIIQCPQCMTLFYKDPEDIAISEEDPEVVNVAEQCQHCGNKSGYTLIGKVAEETMEDETATENEHADLDVEEDTTEEVDLPEMPKDELESEDLENVPAAESTEDTEDSQTSEEEKVEDQENSSEEEVSNENEEDLENETEDEETDEEDEEKKKTESLAQDSREEQSLVESKETEEIENKLDDHSDYVNYLSIKIDELYKKLKEIKNNEIINSINEEIVRLEKERKEALPEAIKDEIDENETELPDVKDLPTKDSSIEKDDAEKIEEALDINDSEDVENKRHISFAEYDTAVRNLRDSFINENIEDKEEDKKEQDLEFDNRKASDLPEMSEENIEKLFNSPEFNTPVSEAEVENYLNDSLHEDIEKEEKVENENKDQTSESEDDVLEPIDILSLEDIDADSFNNHFTELLTTVYSNVESFELTQCEFEEDTALALSGIIHFKSGKTKPTSFIIMCEDSKLVAKNKHLAEGIICALECKAIDKNLVLENIDYKFKIDKDLVEGFTRH